MIVGAAARIGRAARFALLLASLASWVIAGGLPWSSEQRERRVRQGAIEVAGGRPCGWEELATRIAGRHLLLAGFSDGPAKAETLLACSIRARPLYAPTWLARAEASLRSGDVEQADRFLLVSEALWPERPRLLWRVAVLRAQMGNRDEGFRALRKVLQAGGVSKIGVVLRIAEQLDPRPSDWLPQLLPRGEQAAEGRDETLRRILHIAVARSDGALASASWEELSQRARQRRELVDLYAEALLRAGETDRAVATWIRYSRVPGAGVLLTNGGFEADPGQRAFGWRIQATAEASWARDPDVRHGGAHSLRIGFHASRALQFAHASQRIAVEPERRYRLSGYWRGDGITTGSGPYLEAAPRGGHRIASLEPRVGSWDWEPFALEFLTPAHSQIMEIRIRRDREKLDRGFSGTLWLDDLRLDDVSQESLRG